jgi:methoxymalonate biosynthesis acyl carrier protein
MTKEKIINTVQEFLSQFINSRDVGVDLDLFQSGLINSLFAMQLVIFLEQEYGFQIANEDLNMDNFRSLGAISEFVMRKTP